MKSIIQLKTTTQSLLIALTLFCFALLPRAQAVVPPPDGGYPNFNTAEGQKALFSLTSGQWNTALGAFTLSRNTDGSLNTAVGTAALLLNIGNQSAGEGIENTAVGAAALLLNTSGSNNTAVGVDALFSNTTGVSNTATGSGALQNNIASNNTATGYQALLHNTTGDQNTATGYQALFSNMHGITNTANGYRALFSNIGGATNTALGSQALLNNNAGSNNTATGSGALVTNISGDINTANGVDALRDNNDGLGNTAIGASALLQNTTGDNNIALGVEAGKELTTGDNNIDIGNIGVAGEADTIRVGTAQTSTFIAGIFGQASVNGVTVLANSSGKLGTNISSARFKQNIQDMGDSSHALMALRPVTFRYKQELDPDGTAQFGLVAEEVEKVNPALVVRDADGKPYTVRYDAVNAMLLNEFLKEHRRVQKQTQKIQEQETTIAELKKQVQTVVAHAKEQDIKIQRVSDQMQINSSPVVVTDR